MNKHIIIGITGASGAIYALKLIGALMKHETTIHLVISEMGSKVFAHEMQIRLSDIETYLKKIITSKKHLPNNMTIHSPKDMFAPIASGSFPAQAMVIAPCSIKTLAAVASGYSNNLLERAADVTLKEKRPLVLVTRETPINRIHLQNMLNAHDAGATILPASPGFYRHPENINDLIDSIVGRIIDQIGIKYANYNRWDGETMWEGQ